jgi:phosphoglycerate dehydrogenase-like enzyme
MKIAVIEPLSIPRTRVEALAARFRSTGHELTYATDRTTDGNELVDRAGDAEIVVIANCPFPRAVIENLPGLRLLAVAFTGVDHVDLEACRARNVAVCNASGYSTISVAELTLGLMIDLLRHVTRLDPVTRAGGTRAGHIGRDLAGKTLGIVGTGAIGSRVARAALALGCEVLAFSRSKKADLVRDGVRYVPIEELAKTADIVSLHCPLNEKTRGLWGSDLLATMKPSALLVNCARGPVVDSAALTEALREGRLAGAAIDVFDGEPPLDPADPLLDLENVIVTPHIAFATEEAFERRAEIVAGNIEAWLRGEARNLV